MNYYYCSKIREMMKLSKEENKAKIYTANDDTIFVKYCEEFDDFMLQYSWIIDEKDVSLNQEINDVLSKSLSYNSQIDLIQIGMFTVYTKDEEDLCGLIGSCKSYFLKEINDTCYIFCGNKVLRIIQYYGMVRSALENLNITLKWNDTSIDISKSSSGLKGINYNYSKEENKVTFTVGSENSKTTFVENINRSEPQVICIDTFLGILEYYIISKTE